MSNHIQKGLRFWSVSARHVCSRFVHWIVNDCFQCVDSYHIPDTPGKNRNLDLRDGTKWPFQEQMPVYGVLKRTKPVCFVVTSRQKPKRNDVLRLQHGVFRRPKRNLCPWILSTCLQPLKRLLFKLRRLFH